MLYAVLRWSTVATGRLGALAPSLRRKIGSVPLVALNFACTLAGVIDHPVETSWQVTQARPLVPRLWKKALLVSIEPVLLTVAAAPEEFEKLPVMVTAAPSVPTVSGPTPMSQAASTSGAASASAAATPIGDGEPNHLLELGICIETSFETIAHCPGENAVQCRSVLLRCRRYAA